MRRVILACALVGISGPANALDGTPSPANVPIGVLAGDILNSQYWHNPNLLEQVRRLQRAGDDLLAQANPGATASVDPLIGTWKFNPEKSTSNTPMVKSFTNTYAGKGQQFTNNSEGMDAQGQPFKVVARHIYDGMPHPTTGNPDYDSTSLTRTGDTIKWVRFKQGKTVEIGQGVIVPGKTYTITAEGIAASGQ